MRNKNKKIKYFCLFLPLLMVCLALTACGEKKVEHFKLDGEFETITVQALDKSKSNNAKDKILDAIPLLLQLMKKMEKTPSVDRKPLYNLLLYDKDSKLTQFTVYEYKNNSYIDVMDGENQGTWRLNKVLRQILIDLFASCG